MHRTQVLIEERQSDDPDHAGVRAVIERWEGRLVTSRAGFQVERSS